MFFSVILPIYNVEKYLRECVESVLNQTFTDYELILVDDGSKDGSGVICDEYGVKYPDRVKVIHKPNGGQADARNFGMNEATGKYTVYIDSDDFVISNKFLSDVHDKIIESDADVVVYKFVKFYDDTKKFEKCSFELVSEKGLSDDEYLLETVKKDAYYGMAWIKAFRTALAKDNGIEFEKGLTGEDMDWYFSLVLSAKKIVSLNETYIAYRQREGSVTKTMKLKNLTDFICILEKWNKIINETDISETKRLALKGVLAKYYSNLLIDYIRVKDREKKRYKKRIKALSKLLDFSLSARPAKMRKFYKCFGFNGTILLLKLYDGLKKGRV